MSNSRYKLFIEKTRGLEDKIRNYKSYVVDDHYLRQIANWENNTSAKLYKNREQEEINSLKNQKEIFLNMRRNKLRKIQKKEYEMYNQELKNNIDNQEHQRKKKKKKLKKKKRKKKNKKKKFVN